MEESRKNMPKEFKAALRSDPMFQELEKQDDPKSRIEILSDKAGVTSPKVKIEKIDNQVSFEGFM